MRQRVSGTARHPISHLHPHLTRSSSQMAALCSPAVTARNINVRMAARLMKQLRFSMRDPDFGTTAVRHFFKVLVLYGFRGILVDLGVSGLGKLEYGERVRLLPRAAHQPPLPLLTDLHSLSGGDGAAGHLRAEAVRAAIGDGGRAVGPREGEDAHRRRLLRLRVADVEADA